MLVTRNGTNDCSCYCNQYYSFFYWHFEER